MIDSIRVISEGLTAINESLADMMPGPNFDALELKRDEVRAKLDFLTKSFFKDSAKRFIEDSDDLLHSTREMQATLQQLDSNRNTLESVGRFLNAVDSLVQTVARFA
jgi:hypothetical protein